MRILIAEDEEISRMVIEAMLAPYGEFQVTVNGREAIEAFKAALEAGKPFDLVCLDIMMPEVSGQEALCEIRLAEEAQGIGKDERAKIIMTTAQLDHKHVSLAFEECDGYLAKPLDAKELRWQMQTLGLLGESGS